MLKLKKIAITGSIASGKSTVCGIFKELGAYVISADVIAHELLSSSQTVIKRVLELLGQGVLVNNKIDRQSIARLVFRDRELLQRFEEILHPSIREKIEENYRLQSSLTSPPPLFIVEVPLLFELGWEKDYDKTIVVKAALKICENRFEKKTHTKKSDFADRLKRQWSQDEKLKCADEIIVNEGSLADLQQSTKQLYEKLIQQIA